MKGLILYSSLTGNTKTMAQAIYTNFKKRGLDLDLQEIGHHRPPEDYDYALIGAWIDKAKPNKAALKVIEATRQKNLGLFATLGAMPYSDHGVKVQKNLEELLKGKNSLGTYLCPGKVDPKLLKKWRDSPLRLFPNPFEIRWFKREKNLDMQQKRSLKKQETTFLSKLKI
ncbi:flavodoxin family protein [Peptoniphilus sp. oral taxon 375 str. F0436]|nr:flavodoxin family protein [Peptoniphilus sp. oral taxon 375 str. F0436]